MLVGEPRRQELEAAAHTACAVKKQRKEHCCSAGFLLPVQFRTQLRKEQGEQAEWLVSGDVCLFWRQSFWIFGGATVPQITSRALFGVRLESRGCC